MAAVHGFRGAVSLPCVVMESAASGKESYERSGLYCRCSLPPKSKNLVTRNPSLQSTIHLPNPPPPPPLQFSNLYCVFAARLSASAESRASASAPPSDLHCVFAARRSASAESHASVSNLHSVFAARRSASAESRVSASASSAPASSDATESPKLKAFTFKHVLLPVIDRNPYLSESTRQTIATTTALAKQYGADVTVVVINHLDSAKTETRVAQEIKEKHDLQIETIRWHLTEGGCAEYTLVERLGEGQKPAAVIGEMADDLGLDLVIMSMEAIHHKHVDGNLLGEFVPCPILMLPL